MKTPLVLLLLALIVAHARAESWTPSEALLNAVRQIESANGRFTVGDQGRSLGDYQISEAAWADVNSWRKARGLPIYDYDQEVWSKSISRTYASDYLQILCGQLKKRLRRAPSAAELYAAYNMGLSAFARRHYHPLSSTFTQGKGGLGQFPLIAASHSISHP